jgi:hypothetical protein
MLKHKLLSVALLALSAAGGAQAAPVSVTARLDSVEVLQGCLRTLNVEVVQDASVKLDWLVDRAAQTPGSIVEIAPGVEIHTIGEPDTTDLGNHRLQLNRQMLIQAWDSGEVVIPGVQLISGADTFASKPLALKVLTADVDTMTTIHGYGNAIDAPRHFFDFLPNWWWIAALVLLGALAAAVVWYVMRKGGVKRLLKPQAPPLPPYEMAMGQLERLRSRKLCEKGQEREYYTELTEILRAYLEGRFGINAMEMTTTQIKAAVRSNATAREAATQMNQILEMADYVKFAKMRPLPEDNVRSFSQATQFVESTRPQPEPAADAQQNQAAKQQ